MSIALPDVVQTYFEVSNGQGMTRLAECFCEDATVRDEHQTHQGLAAIVEWQFASRQAYSYVAAPLQSWQDGEALVVIARLTGNFPGSPVDLQHHFAFDGGRIKLLEIGS